MKLSDKTLSVLKNFSSINQSILFKEGNKLRTISVMKNILAEATVTEDFSKDFGIYDLNEFIGVLSLVQEPSLKFDEQFVSIADASEMITLRRSSDDIRRFLCTPQNSAP